MHPFPKELLPGGLEVGLQGPLGRGVGGEAGNLDVTGVGPEEDRPRPLLEAGVLEDEGRGEEVGGEHFLHEVPARLPHGSPPRLPHGVDQEVQGPRLLQEGLGLQLVGEVRGRWLDLGCAVGRGTFTLAARTGEPALGLDVNLRATGDLATQQAAAAALADLILPPETGGKKPSELGVPAFVDEWISSYYDETLKDRPIILAGLAWLDDEANRRHGAVFAKLTESQQAGLADDITARHENTRYHPGIELPPTLWASTDATAVLSGASVVVLAVPSQTLRDNLAACVPIANAMGVPIAVLPVLLAVELVPDVFRTLGNVTADLGVTAILSRDRTN